MKRKLLLRFIIIVAQYNVVAIYIYTSSYGVFLFSSYFYSTLGKNKNKQNKTE